MIASLRPGGKITRHSIISSLGNKSVSEGPRRGSHTIGPHNRSVITRTTTTAGGTGRPLGTPLGEKRGINFVQLNMNKSRGSMVELNRLQFDIALVQEPNMTRGRLNFVSPQYGSFCKGTGRAAVIVNNNIAYWPVESLSGADIAVVELETNEGPVIVCSAYLDILKHPVSEELDKLVTFCERQKVALIIGVDTNAHTALWGSNDTNARGSKIEDWILSKGLYVHNKGRTPTFVPRRDVTPTIIDVTITNLGALDWLSNWEVLNEYMSTDHRMISFTCRAKTRGQQCLFRRYRKANWTDFHKCLEKMELPIYITDMGVEDVERIASEITQNLDAALDMVAPKKMRNPPSETWWSKELESRRKEIRRISRRKHMDDTAIANLRELKRDYSKQIRRAKTQSWRDFITRAQSAKEVSKIVQILENPPARRMSLLKDEIHRVLTPEESLDHLLQVHFPDGELNGQIGSEQETIMKDFTGICQYITCKKVMRALESFGDYKSPGPDELPPIALKHIDNRHLEALCLLYKISLATGHVPAVWREMKVTFIPKAGKSDYAVAKAYRPITLSNFLLKALERLVQWYILEYTLTKPLYRQHAYTKGRSCDTALSVFINDIEYAIYNGKYLLAVSLDCSGAFDCIKFHSAENNMKEHGIPTNIVRWYMSLLKGRRVHAEVQGQRTHVIPHRGSPQGGVLSPLVWNLILDSLLRTFQKDSIRVLGYADDILLYITGKSPTTMAEMMERSLRKVLDWGGANGLTFNPAKTSMVLFTRGRRVPEVHVRLGDTPLKLKDSFRYLGVEIQKNLLWTKHVKERANKCKFLLGKCRNLISRSWGLNPMRMEWVYKAIIRPKLTYGAVVWAARLTKGMENHLNKVQRLALLSITQPLRSTPTAGLEALIGWMPMSLHAQEVGMNTYLRNKDQITTRWDGIGTQRAITGHLGIWRKTEQDSLGLNYPRIKTISERVWIENGKEPEEQMEFPLAIYTDAAKTGEDVGYSWIASIGDYVIAEDISSAKDISIFRAELLAIYEAVKWLQSNLDITRVTKIYSDSLGATQKLNGNLATEELTRDIMTMLLELNQKTKTEITWVKAHSGIVGNELVDMMAKDGAQKATKLHDTKPHLPITRGETREVNIFTSWEDGSRAVRLRFP